MLGTIRKFSSSIFAKVLLLVVAIPFIFWGMGDVFSGGNKNTIFKIGRKNYSTQEFIEYAKNNLSGEQEVSPKLIENLLTKYIGEKLILEEIESFKIQLSENSLSHIIKDQDIFKKNDSFSRTEYEKFLITNGISAINFEKFMSNQEKKKQILNLIGGGIVPPNFLVDSEFNKINQKRIVEIINLNELFEKKINIKNEEIKSYFDNNKNKYNTKYKTIEYIKLTPKKLTETDQYNDLFFKKIDEIDDLIVNGKNISYLLSEYNLGSSETLILDKNGKDTNSNTIKNLPFDLIQKAYEVDDDEPTRLVTHVDQYYIFHFVKSENIQKDVSDENIKLDIKSIIEANSKRKLISDLIVKINNNQFKKSDFDEISKKENISIKKIKIENQNDSSSLKKEFVKQIYSFPEKKVVIATDVNLSDILLVFINSVENVEFSNDPDDYKKYMNLSKKKLTNSLYKTYDTYLKKKYEIDINYKALESANNYFR